MTETREEILAGVEHSKMMANVRDMTDEQLCDLWTTQFNPEWKICREAMEQTIDEHPEIYYKYFGE